MSLVSCIKRSKPRTFRRIYMRRREANGDFESTWQQIDSEYIMRYGNIQYSIDDILPNVFKYNSAKIKLFNKNGYFADVTEDRSFFYGKLSLYKTLVRIDGGYIDDDLTEYPTNATLFLGLIGEDYNYTEESTIEFSLKHLSSILDEVPADLIPGLGATQTAYSIATKIRDFTDGNSIAVFQKYISAGAWYLDTTTAYYNMATSTSLQNVSCWQLLEKLAIAENFSMYIDRSGGFHFENKGTVASVPAFHFSGVGDTDKTFGHNVAKQISVSDNIRKVYNRIRIKIGADETLTSFYIKNEVWNWGDSSSSFKFGVREYRYNNDWLTTSTAATIADRIYNEFVWPKQEIRIQSKFVPQLMVEDYVTLTYKTKRYSGDALWGNFNWGGAVWGERLGYNIFVDNANYRITNLEHNLDDFTSRVTMRAY